MAATHGEGAYGDGVGVTTPAEHKLAQAGGIVKTTTGVRAGLFWNGSATVVVGKANMSYDVVPFTCASSRGASSGVLMWANDAVVNVPTTAAPGSNSRVDVVYAWHREFSLDGGNSDPVIGVVQGTAAASPSIPSLAAFPGAIELARSTVSAGMTATTSAVITQTAPFTAMAGGVVMFRNAPERNSSGVLVGQEGYLLSDNSPQVLLPGGWQSTTFIRQVGGVTRIDANVGISAGTTLIRGSDWTILRVIATRPAGFLNNAVFATATISPSDVPAFGSMTVTTGGSPGIATGSIAIDTGGNIRAYFGSATPGTAIQGTIVWPS